MNLDIVTYTGKAFDLLNPKPEMVCIEDIAHSLAYQCRYTGHTRGIYSVAQHSVLMAENSDLPGNPLLKLLHDAAETYIGDIAKPWKRLLLVRYIDIKSYPIQVKELELKEFEQKIQDVIGLALGVDLSYSAEVKEADWRMMATEIRDLMPEMSQDFAWGYKNRKPVKEIIVCWEPEYAEQAFLKCYNKLKGD